MTTRAEAIATAEGVAGRAWAETSALAAEGGIEAVADAAHEPGGPSRQVIAAEYAAMQAVAAAEIIASREMAGEPGRMPEDQIAKRKGGATAA